MTERCKRCGALRHAVIHTVLHGAGAHAFLEPRRYWGLTPGEWAVIVPSALLGATLLYAGALLYLLAGSIIGLPPAAK